MATYSPLWTLLSVATGAVLTFLITWGMERRRERTARRLQKQAARSRWSGLQLGIVIELELFVQLAFKLLDRTDDHVLHLKDSFAGNRATLLSIYEASFDLLALEDDESTRKLIRQMTDHLRGTVARAYGLAAFNMQVRLAKETMAKGLAEIHAMPEGETREAAIAELMAKRREFERAFEVAFEEDLKVLHDLVKQYRANIDSLPMLQGVLSKRVDRNRTLANFFASIDRFISNWPIRPSARERITDGLRAAGFTVQVEEGRTRSHSEERRH